jgi:monovalent cation/hydrogen antiporter
MAAPIVDGAPATLRAMDQAEVLIVGLLVAVAGLSALARVLHVPYPIVLVIGGAAVGFIPGLPKFELNPDVVLLVFLPPLVYAAAFFSDFRYMRGNLRGLTLSSVGLVLATMAAVAVIAHELIPGLPWAAAFALGAVVSPTDPLAGAVIMRRIGVPARLVSAAESEGLFNDATALVAYRVAVAAAIGGGFSLAEASMRFVGGAAAGIAIGIAIGWVIVEIRKRIEDAQLSITISLLSGYAAFVPADAIGASGVLAAVTTGIFVGLRGPRIIPARVRLQGFYVWDVLDFLLNASLFVLVGLQLRTIVEGLTGSWSTLLGWAAAVSGAVVLVRLVWFFTVPYLIRMLDRRPQQRARRVGPRPRLVLAWAGMRGAVSLAAALAIPFETDAGAPFPQRDLIIFLTYAVIFATLVFQGLTLPVLIRLLRLEDDGDGDREEVKARLVATKAALAQIDALANEEWTREDTIDRMRAAYTYRKRRFAARVGAVEDDGYEDRSIAYQRMLQSVLGAQREALVRLRSDGDVSNEVMNRIVRELDLEESRLEI